MLFVKFYVDSFKSFQKFSFFDSSKVFFFFEVSGWLFLTLNQKAEHKNFRA